MIGQKMKQTRMFDERGINMPVTQILVGPMTVIEVKKAAAAREARLVLAFGKGNRKSLKKAEQGYFDKLQYKEVPKFIREVAFTLDKDEPEYTPGQQLSGTQVFTVGDKVKVTGVSKAKGFAGVVKRHGFAGGPRTHGQSDRERAPGSIGQTTTPGRVYKGKRMAGRMGTQTVSVQGLRIIAIDEAAHMVMVKGLVPGNLNNLVTITKQK